MAQHAPLIAFNCAAEIVRQLDSDCNKRAFEQVGEALSSGTPGAGKVGCASNISNRFTVKGDL